MKKDLITKLVDDLDSWDYESLLEYAKDARRSGLSDCSIKELKDELVQIYS